MTYYKINKKNLDQTTCYVLNKATKLRFANRWTKDCIAVLDRFLKTHLKQYCDKNDRKISWSFNVTVIGKNKMKKLNHQYRGKNKATDVLSFPALTWTKNRKKFLLEARESDFCLGDIVICQEKVISQAKEYNVSKKDEFLHLLTHGYLHLLGFDHELSKKDAKLMQAAEDLIIDQLSLKFFKTRQVLV